MPSIQWARERFDQTRESRGQGENLYATLEKTQWKRRWGMESVSDLHIGQRSSTGGKLRKEFSLVFVGRISQAIFHKKSFNLSLSWSFHNFFQEFGFKGDKAEINLGELTILKANLEEKFPFVEVDQRNVDG